MKIAILLNLAGPDAIELYNTFTLSDADAKKYTKVVKAFEQYCSPRKNIVFERFTFWQCAQAEEENVDQFVTRLKRIAKRCEFKDEEEMLRYKMLRDKIFTSIIHFLPFITYPTMIEILKTIPW